MALSHVGVDVQRNVLALGAKGTKVATIHVPLDDVDAVWTEVHGAPGGHGASVPCAYQDTFRSADGTTGLRAAPSPGAALRLPALQQRLELPPLPLPLGRPGHLIGLARLMQVGRGREDGREGALEGPKLTAVRF
jgi:hypothetical protein